MAGVIKKEGSVENIIDDEIFEAVERIRNEYSINFRIDLDHNLIFARLEEHWGLPNCVEKVFEQFLPRDPQQFSGIVGQAHEDDDSDWKPEYSASGAASSQRNLADEDQKTCLALNSIMKSPISNPNSKPVKGLYSIEEAIRERNEQKLNGLLGCFPDADVDYLRSIVYIFKSPQDLNQEVERMIENKDYPKKLVERKQIVGQSSEAKRQ